jgi:hypothetical protein
MGDDLVKASVSFASCVFVGRPMDDVSFGNMLD